MADAASSVAWTGVLLEGERELETVVGVWSGYLDRRKIRPFTIKRETDTDSAPKSRGVRKGEKVVPRYTDQ